MQMMLGGLLLYLGSRSDIRGARAWAAAFVLNGISLFVFAIVVPEAWLPQITTINHLTLGASGVCFLIGFWDFGRQRQRNWILILLLLIPLLSLLAWEVLWPNSRMRVLSTASGYALFLMALQHSLGLAPRVELAQIYRRLRYVVWLYLLIYIWAYASIADLLPTTARTDASYHKTFFSMASLMFMLSLAVGCLALQFGLLAARNGDLAMEDWLTGLLNRRGFFRGIGRDARLQLGRCNAAAVIMLDIDHFKHINDRYGHAFGDSVLQTLADVMRELMAPGQLVARMGGEEFCIVIPDAHLAAATLFAQRIRARFADIALTSDSNEKVRFTLSAGVSEALPEQSLESAIAQADAALYQAKRGGRDQVVSSGSQANGDPPH